jgi:hypothetical protein
MFKSKFLLTHLKKSHIFKVSICLMIYIFNNLYDFFCRYTHPKRKDKKRTTSESMEELKNDLTNDLWKNIKLSFKSWLTKLESLRSSLLVPGRGRVDFIPFITLGVLKNY